MPLSQPTMPPSRSGKEEGESDKQYDYLLSEELNRARAKDSNYLELDLRERRLKTYYAKSTLYCNKKRLELRWKIELGVREYRARGLLEPAYYKRDWPGYNHDYNDAALERDLRDMEDVWRPSCACKLEPEKQYKCQYDRDEALKIITKEAAKARKEAIVEFEARNCKIL